MQMLSNLFKAGWKWKNVDIICYILTSLVCLHQGNIEKSKKFIILVDIGEESLHIFQTTGKILIKLKVTKSRALPPL